MATSKKNVNFRQDVEIINKLAYIAWHDRETVTDIYNSLAEAHIKKWENKNGAITDKQLKEARIIE